MITIRNLRNSFTINKNSISNRTFFHVLRIPLPTIRPGWTSRATSGSRGVCSLASSRLAERIAILFLVPRPTPRCTKLIANLAIRTPRNSHEPIHIRISNSQLLPLFSPGPDRPCFFASMPPCLKVFMPLGAEAAFQAKAARRAEAAVQAKAANRHIPELEFELTP